MNELTNELDLAEQRRLLRSWLTDHRSPTARQLAEAGLAVLAAYDARNWREPGRRTVRIDFVAASRFRMRCLREAAARFFVQEPSNEAFIRFCATESGWLDDYSLFMAVGEQHPGRTWPDWPVPLAGRDPAALADARAVAQAPFEARYSDPDAVYEAESCIDITSLEPQVSLPGGVHQAVGIGAVAGEPIQHAFIGSCGSSMYEDIAAAARFLFVAYFDMAVSGAIGGGRLDNDALALVRAPLPHDDIADSERPAMFGQQHARRVRAAARRARLIPVAYIAGVGRGRGDDGKPLPLKHVAVAAAGTLLIQRAPVVVTVGPHDAGQLVG